jgi:arylformamidase
MLGRSWPPEHPIFRWIRANTDGMTAYRAEFDAEVSFSNGGSLTTKGFRIDMPGPDVEEGQIGALFIASLGLLMVDRVELSRTTVFPEAHKGTRGGPSDSGLRARPNEEDRWQLD